MAISNLTGTTWQWNFGSFPPFYGADQSGIVKNINFMSHGESFTSMTFKRYHGGDINVVYYDNIRPWYVDLDGGSEENGFNIGACTLIILVYKLRGCHLLGLTAVDRTQLTALGAEGARTRLPAVRRIRGIVLRCPTR